MTDHARAGDPELFTIATSGYVAFVLNLYASMQRAGIGQSLVVYALDRAAHVAVERAGLRSRQYGHGERPAWSDFGTNEFARTMAFKYLIAVEILRSGRSAMYVDSDVVMLRDPVPNVLATLATADAHLAMQVEEPLHLLNAGFWCARPARPVIDLFSSLAERIMNSSAYIDDQKELNRILPHDPSVRWTTLHPEQYACGNQFLPGRTVEEGGVHIDRSGAPFPFNDAFVLHFNFLTTKQQKVLAMLKTGMVLHPDLAREVPILKRLRGVLWRKPRT